VHQANKKPTISEFRPESAAGRHRGKYPRKQTKKRIVFSPKQCITSAQRPCRVLKGPRVLKCRVLNCIQTSIMCINVFSLRTRPCSWPLTWTLRAPVSPKCVVSPLPSGLPYCVTLFGSILKTAHIQSEYWVPGRPTQAMTTRQHQNVTCGA